MSISVRPAGPDDATDLIALSAAFNDGGNHLAHDTSQVAAWLRNNPGEHVFVADCCDQLVGFATLSVTASFAFTRPTAELTALFVLPAYRRLGVATRMMAAVRRTCEDLNCLELFLRVSRANERAIAFYEAVGLEQAIHHEYRLKYDDT